METVSMLSYASSVLVHVAYYLSKLVLMLLK